MRRSLRSVAGLILAFWLGATTLGAWSLMSIPNTFTAGTTIVAADMNSNFSEVSSKYNTMANSSTGHRHDGGTDDGDRRVLATDLDSTGSKTGQVLIPSGSITTWTAQEHMLSGRLERQSATQLRYNVYAGRYLEINGEVYTVDGTAAGGQIDTTDNLITATGADAGAAMGASTVYYVYCSNASASPFASDCRGSTTAASAYRGGQYLGTSGNAANWRLVGLVRTNGSTQFVDSASQRFVLSYFNRRRIAASVTDANNRTSTSTSLVEVSTTRRVEFLSWADEWTDLIVQTEMRQDTAGQITRLGLQVDATTGSLSGSYVAIVQFTSNGLEVAAASHFAANLSEGYHYLTPMISVSANTGTHLQDNLTMAVIRG